MRESREAAGIRHRYGGSRLAASLLAVAVLVGPIVAEARDAVDPAVPGCAAPAELLRLTRPMPRLAARSGDDGPLRIVALGSSSTFGLGASAPSRTYPARLEETLRRLRPGRSITVVNRGVNGEEARDELLRLSRDVLDAPPDLVIWQLGTNALLHGRDLGQVANAVRDGIHRLRARGIDVLLMNTQYSPKVLAHPDHARMNELIATIGRDEGVNVFDRFAIMKAWVENDRRPFDAFVTADGLHMNDWGYGCIADLLAIAIVEGMAGEIRRPAPEAAARP